MIIDANRGESARKALRAGTAACHERVDSLFSTFDLARRGDYARFLQAQAAAFIPVEAALGQAGVGAIVGNWDARRRSAALFADLVALGIATPLALPEPELKGEAAVIGALYVLEGSRLGGQVLKRSVAAGLPVSFLAAGEAGAWRALLQIIDERLRTADEIAAATKAAEQVFTLFEKAGQAFQESDE